MNLKTFFGIIYSSFFSKELYFAVIERWNHWGLNFLIRFSVLVTVTASLVFYLIIANINLNSPELLEFMNNIPEIKVTNGIANYVRDDIQSPYIIQDQNSHQTVITMDLSSSDQNQYVGKSLFAFLSDKIAFYFFPNSPISLTYTDLIEGKEVKNIDANFLLEFLSDQQKKVLNIILYIGCTLGSIIYFLLTILKVSFYSSIAYVVSLIFKLNLTFKQLVRLAIIANIPSVIVSSLFSILIFLNISLSQDSYIVNGVFFLYFIGAIYLYAKERSKN